AEVRSQARRRHERGQPRGEPRLVRYMHREERRVAPERWRTGLDALARQRSVELVQVVDGLKRSEATRTGPDAFELQLVAAAGAEQVCGGHGYLLGRLALH